MNKEAYADSGWKDGRAWYEQLGICGLRVEGALLWRCS